jgi:hypothetical protein
VIDREPDVDVEQAAERLSNGECAAQVSPAERGSARVERADPREHVVEAARIRQLLDAVLNIDRVHEGLHHPERLRGRLPVSGIGQHAISVAKLDTTVKV